MKRGSEKYETEIMKDEEVLLFVETAIENGASMKDAFSDMKFIDTCLHIRHLNFAMGNVVRRTKAGHLRKGVGLYDDYMNLVQARIDNKF